MIRADMLGSGSVDPARLMDNRALVEHCGDSRNPEEIFAKTGIATRRWVAPESSACKLASQAVSEALEEAGVGPAELRRLIFVSSTGGDFLIPANANGVLHHLGIAGTCDGFDLNNACMGFLSAFDVAARCVATGLGPVCVVVAETLSHYLDPDNPRPYMVLADAIAAVVLGDSGSGGGILSAVLGNDGTHRGTVWLSHPGRTGQRELIQFTDSNREITRLAVNAMLGSATQALEKAGLELSEMDWIVPHQPNGNMLKLFVERVGVDSEKLVTVVDRIGSVGAGSMAMGLHALRRTRPVRPGHRILLVGVGAGMSYGSVVYQTGSGDAP